MAAMSSSFRLPDKDDAQWLRYDDLFDQLIESEPFDFSYSDSPGDLNSPVELTKFFEFSDPLNDSDASNNSARLIGGDGSSESQGPAPAVPSSTDPSDESDPLNLLLSPSPNTLNALVPALSNPVSPRASSTSHSRTASDSSTSSFISSRFSSAGVRKSYRATSPKMVSQPSFSRRSAQDHWAQRLEASAEHLNMQYQRAPLSPPTSEKQQWEEQNHASIPDFKYNARRQQQQQQQQVQLSYQNGTATQWNIPFNQPHHAHTPLATPQPELRLPSNASAHFSSRTPSTSYSSADMSFGSAVTSPQTDRSSSWEYGAISPVDTFSMELSSNSHFDTTKVQPWWPSTDTAGLTQPGSASYPHQRYQQRLTAGVDSQHGFARDPSLAMGGLMIRSNQGSGVLSSSAPQPQAYTPASLHPYQSARLQRHASRHREPSQESSSSRGRSPSVPASRSTPSRSATSGVRRTPRAHHRRTKSGSSSTQASPAAPSVGFVNFTPSDSKRILTGVAPSGSSKTKARREREAAERRRRLSQAATRAVLEAGGDLSKLSDMDAAGLFE